MEASLRDWLLGCNPWGTSMIVGYPEMGDTPVDPHSAFTAVFNYEIDGGLIDGPVYSSIFSRLRGLRIVHGDEYADFQSDLCVYHDDYGDYSTNEPTMDGTASLTFYFSSLEVKSDEMEYLRTILDQGGIVRGDTSTKNIHLVFTGGDYNDGGSQIRKILKQHDIKASFFFTGDFYRLGENYKLIKRLKKDGHYLGAHSDKHLLYVPWDNRDSLLISKHDFIEDLRKNYREMARFGIYSVDAPYFLPPYEWYNKTISKWTRELGLILINFTPGTRSNADYTTPDMGDQYVSSDTIYQKIMKYERDSDNGLNGFILLFHIGTHPNRSDKFYFKLDDLITELHNKGYRFTLFNSEKR
jgi:peptidoglycan/xylan/chitin deacetylase (PgdA/CDA1 family)